MWLRSASVVLWLALALVACGDADPPADPIAPAAPDPPPRDEGARLVVAPGFSCLRTDASEVVCWGRARGADETRAPHVVRELHGATDLTASEFEICGRLPSGHVTCARRDLGSFFADEDLPPGGRLVADRHRVCAIGGDEIVCHNEGLRQRAGPVPRGATLHAAGDTVCAVGGEGPARCLNRGDARTWELGGAEHVVAVAQLRRPCALRDDGALLCADAEAIGAAALVPTGETGISAIGGGRETACVLREHHLRCEGPDGVVELDGVATFAASDAQTCALLEGGEVRCWGESHAGETGPVEPLVVPTRRAHPAPEGVNQVLAEDGVLHYVDAHGALWTERGGIEPSRVELEDPLLGLARYGMSTCGITRRGVLRCPPARAFEDIHLGARGPALSIAPPRRERRPHEVCAPSARGVACVRGGLGDRFVARTSHLDGLRQPFSFGGRICGTRRGQLVCPAEQGEDHQLPAALAGATRLFGGIEQIFAVMPEGVVLAMGHNGAGQLGLPPSRPIGEPTPTPVPIAPTHMAFAHHASCAWAEGSALFCAGLDEDFDVPMASGGTGQWREITGPRDVVAVSLGQPSCAVTRGREVWCWGRDPARSRIAEPRRIELPAPSPSR